MTPSDSYTLQSVLCLYVLYRPPLQPLAQTLWIPSPSPQLLLEKLKLAGLPRDAGKISTGFGEHDMGRGNNYTVRSSWGLQGLWPATLEGSTPIANCPSHKEPPCIPRGTY